MALATEPNVRLLLGWDQDDTYRLFQLDDDAALTAYIEFLIPFASADITKYTPDDYPPADATKLTAYTQAEIWQVGVLAVERLKTLKATGRHFPYDSEESAALQALIDQNYHERVRDALTGYTQVDEPGGPMVVVPAFGVGSLVNTSTSQTWEQELQDILNESKGLVGRS